MFKRITLSDFRAAFYDYGRQDNFSYEGIEALYNYLEALEESTGEQIELDVIGLCCEFTEYEDEDEVRENYGLDEDEDLEDYTQVIYFNTGIIIHDF